MSNIIDKKILTKYIAGFIMGDGGLSNLKNYNPEPIKKRSIESKRNSHYYMKQIDTHLDYIQWQMEIIKNITSASITYSEPYVDSRGYSCNGQYVLKTSNHPFFTEIRKRMYLNDKKVLDPHYLKLMDWEMLATIYMDNGWIETKQTQTKGVWTRVSIATMAYSYADNKMLRDFIFENFGISFDVNFKTARSGEIHYYLRNTKDNAKRFLDGVSKYVVPSYQYKISHD